MKYVFIILVIAIGIGGFAYVNNGKQIEQQSPEDKFYEACVVVLKDRLKSPSSYLLIKRYPVSYSPYSVEWEMGWENAADEASYRSSATPPYLTLLKTYERYAREFEYFVAETLISYEASNSYGASMASVAFCELRVKGKVLLDDYDADSYYIRIDGQTSRSWLDELISSQ